MTAKADGKMVKRQGSVASLHPGPAVTIGAETDRQEGPDSLRPIGGSGSRALNTVLANQAFASLWLPSGILEADRDQRI